MKKVEDFGQKIGGARKDLWSSRGLEWEDTFDMSDSEKEKYICRDSIWKKEDIKQLLAQGADRYLVYWKNEMRKCVHTKPVFHTSDKLQEYVSNVAKFRDAVNAVSDSEDIMGFYASALSGVFLIHTSKYHFDYAPGFCGVIIGNTFLKHSTVSGQKSMRIEMEKKRFGLSKEEILAREYPIFPFCEKNMEYKTERGEKYLVVTIGHGKYYYHGADETILANAGTDSYFLNNVKSRQILYAGTEKECTEKRCELAGIEETKAASKHKRKKSWMPPQLSHIQRTGRDVRNGIPVTGQYFIDDFGLRGGEFGNWTNDLDRQSSMDMCYEAFADLAETLGISTKDIGLPYLQSGGLGIAFGARGIGNYVAHYEPLLEVINITKMRGAGSLSHEWGHALDNMLGKICGVKGFLTEEGMKRVIPSTGIAIYVLKMMDAMKYKGNDKSKRTDYYENSLRMDGLCAKSGHGYWHSNVELFARAFACYVLDRCPCRSDYLNGHAESAIMPSENGIVYAYPRGEERKMLNELFDGLFRMLLDKEIFHPWTEPKPEWAEENRGKSTDSSSATQVTITCNITGDNNHFIGHVDNITNNYSSKTDDSGQLYFNF